MNKTFYERINFFILFSRLVLDDRIALVESKAEIKFSVVSRK